MSDSAIAVAQFVAVLSCGLALICAIDAGGRAVQRWYLRRLARTRGVAYTDALVARAVRTDGMRHVWQEVRAEYRPPTEPHP